MLDNSLKRSAAYKVIVLMGYVLAVVDIVLVASRQMFGMTAFVMFIVNALFCILLPTAATARRSNTHL